MGKQVSVGRIFQRSYRDRSGDLQKTSTWYLKYRVAGKSVVIPTGTPDYEEAVLIFRRKLARACVPHPSNETSCIALNELLDLVVRDYRSKGRHTAYDVEHRVDKHLRPFFGTKQPFEITDTLLHEYIQSRTRNARPSTVNKELAYLRRALRLGYRHDPQLVKVVPSIPAVPLSNIRISEHDEASSEPANQQLIRRLEQHIQAKNRRLSGSDMVLDENAERR